MNKIQIPSAYHTWARLKKTAAQWYYWMAIILFSVPLSAESANQILWYPFNETAGLDTTVDASGNGHDGIIVGGVTLDGEAAHLNGIDGHIQLPNNIMAGLKGISITALVQINRSQGSPYFIYGLGNTSGDRGDGYLFATGNHYRTTLSDCHWVCEQNTSTERINLGRGNWHHLAYTLAEGIGILYMDGKEVGRNTNITLTPADIGNGVTTANFLGRSLYGADQYFDGSFRDFQIWDGALDSETIATAATLGLAKPVPDDKASVAMDTESLSVVNIDDVRGHLFLPTKGQNGTKISWKSSAPNIIDRHGIVQRARACKGRKHRHKHFDSDHHSKISAPTLSESLAGKSHHKKKKKHKKKRCRCGKTQYVTLTAKIKKGKKRKIKKFRATVPPLPVTEDFKGYVFTYFTGEGDPNGEQVYFALSNGNNALDWQPLNQQAPVLTSAVGEQGARDPFLIRSPEGDKFYLIATDLKIHGNWDWNRSQTWGSQSLLVWESNDLIHWSDSRRVQVSPEEAGNTWAPEAFWDAERQSYVVFWASKIYADVGHSNNTYNRMMYSLTRDFVNFSEAKVWVDAGYSIIDSTIVEHDETYYRFTKDERSASESACGKFIFSETSHSLSELNWVSQAECIAQGEIAQGEGPLVFKSNIEEKWYMFVDEFGGRGYVPFESTDLSSGEWTPSSDYNLPSQPRHGTVLPITEKEYQALLQKWGN